jgi:predicted negative regulator of RcsB-dependent stress response
MYPSWLFPPDMVQRMFFLTAISRKDASMKGTERHHLKEDEFVHGMHWFFHFFRRWRREFVLGALLLIGIGVLFSGFQIVRTQQDKSQSKTLGEIQTLRADLTKTPANLAKLEALAGKGKFGRVASLNLATYWVEQGQLDKAQAALSAVKDSPKDFYYYQAKDLSAQVALLKGDIDGAIAVWKKIAEEKPKEYLLDAVLFRQAEALEKGEHGRSPALVQKSPGRISSKLLRI